MGLQKSLGNTSATIGKLSCTSEEDFKDMASNASRTCRDALSYLDGAAVPVTVADTSWKYNTLFSSSFLCATGACCANTRNCFAMVPNSPESKPTTRSLKSIGSAVSRDSGGGTGALGQMSAMPLHQPRSITCADFDIQTSEGKGAGTNNANVGTSVKRHDVNLSLKC